MTGQGANLSGGARSDGRSRSPQAKAVPGPLRIVCRGAGRGAGSKGSWAFIRCLDRWQGKLEDLASDAEDVAKRAREAATTTSQLQRMATLVAVPNGEVQRDGDHDEEEQQQEEETPMWQFWKGQWWAWTWREGWTACGP